jgi:hypothetical protein
MPGLHALGWLACCVLSVFSGCVDSSETGSTGPSSRPRIAYDSPVRDTVGLSVSYAVKSSGGTVSSYTVNPALPEGLHLDSLTGLISGFLPMMDPTDFTITGKGPGGMSTAIIRMEPRQSSTIPPRVFYGSDLVDTLGRPFSHKPLSTGGVATSYSIEPFLPFGITLNGVTGEISGTPMTLQAAKPYRILISGPGGADTADITLAVVKPLVKIELGGSLSLKGIPAQTPPEQVSQLRLSSMTIRIYNDKVPGKEILDTILPGAGFSSTPFAQEVTFKNYSFAAQQEFMHEWRASLSIRDDKGREVYKSQDIASCEANRCSLKFYGPLEYPYSSYGIAFQLPDLIQIGDGGAKETIRFERLTASFDGGPGVDSVAPLYFTPNGTAYLHHFMTWESEHFGGNFGTTYPRDVTLRAYGKIGSRPSELLFQGTLSVPSPRKWSGEKDPSGGRVLSSLNWVGSLPYSGTLSVATGPVGTF